MRQLGLSIVLGVVSVACGGSALESGSDGGSAGLPSSGGSSSGQGGAGGTMNIGGASGGLTGRGGVASGGVATGGTATTGGVASGGVATGGTATGGTGAVAGNASGGVNASGGAGGRATGGTASTGGSTSTGGSNGGSSATGGVTQRGGAGGTGGNDSRCPPRLPEEASVCKNDGLECRYNALNNCLCGGSEPYNCTLADPTCTLSSTQQFAPSPRPAPPSDVAAPVPLNRTCSCAGGHWSCVIR